MMKERGRRGGAGSARGQSTLEYILVLLAVLIAVAAAAKQFIEPNAGKGIDQASQVIADSTGKLKVGLGL